MCTARTEGRLVKATLVWKSFLLRMICPFITNPVIQRSIAPTRKSKLTIKTTQRNENFTYFVCSYTVFKKKLVEYFKKSQSEREARDRYLTVTYCKLTSQWTKKVDRVENSRKRKEREGRSREMYEKIFPELRKQREDKERDARLGTRGVVKSDADFEDVIERLQEQEVRLKV